MTPEELRHQTDTLFARADSIALNVLQRARPGVKPAIEQRIERPKAVVYIASHEGQKEVLRLSASPRFSAHNIAKAYRAWGQAGIPVPNVRATGIVDTAQYLLMDYIEEPPFTFDLPTSVQVKVAAQMGRLLAKMRGVGTAGFGYLDKAGKGKSRSWGDVIRTYYDHKWIAEQNYLTRDEVAAIERIKTLNFPENNGVLLHGDYKFKNAFVAEDGDITAVTDPNPMAGDPLWDFAVFNHFVFREQARQNKPYGDTSFAALREAFKEGYEMQLGRNLEDTELHRIALYEILIDAGKAESLQGGKLDEAKGESDFILDYLRHKIRQLAL